MHYARKYRIYPTEEQRKEIELNFDCVREVYNHFIEVQKTRYENKESYLNFYAMNHELVELKKTETHLQNADSSALSYSLRNLDRAYRNFFAGRARYPRYKRDDVNFASYTTVYRDRSKKASTLHNLIKLPKIGLVKTGGDFDIPTGGVNVTIKRVSSGKYYAIIVQDIEKPEDKVKTQKEGIIRFDPLEKAIIVNGIRYKYPQEMWDLIDRVPRRQQALSYKVKGSNNWEKERKKLARLYEKISSTREDFLNKLSTTLITDFDYLLVEDIAIDRHKKGTSDVNLYTYGWDAFVLKLQYKASWYGKCVKLASDDNCNETREDTKNRQSVSQV